MSETEFNEEEKIFRKSLHFTYKDSDNLSGHIQEELSRIGPLADDIREGVAEDKKRWNTATQKIPDDGFPHGLPGDKPFVRSERKVGRNDPCPCGSGKKYKKCCGKH